MIFLKGTWEPITTDILKSYKSTSVLTNGRPKNQVTKIRILKENKHTEVDAANDKSPNFNNTYLQTENISDDRNPIKQHVLLIKQGNADIDFQLNNNKNQRHKTAKDIPHNFKCQLAVIKTNSNKFKENQYFPTERGFLGTVKSTPGEMELKKQYSKNKECSGTDNIVLPPNYGRVTKTTQDKYDPDKLNMRNLVQFLKASQKENRSNSFGKSSSLEFPSVAMNLSLKASRRSLLNDNSETNHSKGKSITSNCSTRPVSSSTLFDVQYKPPTVVRLCTTSCGELETKYEQFRYSKPRSAKSDRGKNTMVVKSENVSQCKSNVLDRSPTERQLADTQRREMEKQSNRFKLYRFLDKQIRSRHLHSNGYYRDTIEDENERFKMLHTGLNMDSGEEGGRASNSITETNTCQEEQERIGVARAFSSKNLKSSDESFKNGVHDPIIDKIASQNMSYNEYNKSRELTRATIKLPAVVFDDLMSDIGSSVDDSNDLDDSVCGSQPLQLNDEKRTRTNSVDLLPKSSDVLKLSLQRERNLQLQKVADQKGGWDESLINRSRRGFDKNKSKTPLNSQIIMLKAESKSDGPRQMKQKTFISQENPEKLAHPDSFRPGKTLTKHNRSEFSPRTKRNISDLLL